MSPTTTPPRTTMFPTPHPSHPPTHSHQPIPHLLDVSLGELHHAADAAMRASHEAGTYDLQQHASLSQSLLVLESLLADTLAALSRIVTGTTNGGEGR